MSDVVIELKLNPATGGWEANLDPSAAPGDGSLSASMGIAQQVNDFSKFEVMGVPVGLALASSAVAGVGDIAIHFLEPMLGKLGDQTGVLGGLQPGQRRAIMLALAAWGVRSRFVKGFVGEASSQGASLILAYEAMQNVFDARAKVRSLAHSLGLGSHIPGGPTIGHEFDALGNRGRLSDRTEARTDQGVYSLARMRMTGV